MPCSSRIISEMLSEIYTVEKCDFINSIIHSQMISLLVFKSPRRGGLLYRMYIFLFEQLSL